jgi:hypothetical protein
MPLSPQEILAKLGPKASIGSSSMPDRAVLRQWQEEDQANTKRPHRADSPILGDFLTPGAIFFLLHCEVTPLARDTGILTTATPGHPAILVRAPLYGTRKWLFLTSKPHPVKELLLRQPEASIHPRTWQDFLFSLDPHSASLNPQDLPKGANIHHRPFPDKMMYCAVRPHFFFREQRHATLSWSQYCGRLSETQQKRFFALLEQ